LVSNNQKSPEVLEALPSDLKKNKDVSEYKGKSSSCRVGGNYHPEFIKDKGKSCASRLNSAALKPFCSIYWSTLVYIIMY